MQMIDVLKRLSELDEKNPNVYKDTAILNKKESLDECGMMPSSSPASINMTAGSAEELSHMLQDIMSLAGLSKAAPDVVTGHDHDTDSMKRLLDTMNEPAEEGVLGTMAGAGLGAALGGPLGAAAGGVAGNAIGDTFDDEPAEEGVLGTMAGAGLGAALGGPLGAAVGGVAGDKLADKFSQEEGFDNTPEDPRNAPRHDSNKFAYDPNDGDHRERQAGLPRAVPMETMEQKLYKEYQEFVAEGKKAKCNHTPKGKECPVHGLKECGNM